MIAPKKKPVVKLIGENGNAYLILGKVKQALKKEGADQEYIDKFLNEAKSGNYDNLLCVCMEYADIR